MRRVHDYEVSQKTSDPALLVGDCPSRCDGQNRDRSGMFVR